MMKEASDEESLSEDLSSSNDELNSDEENIHQITTRTTRTRHIKIPKKLISALSSEKLP